MKYYLEKKNYADNIKLTLYSEGTTYHKLNRSRIDENVSEYLNLLEESLTGQIQKLELFYLKRHFWGGYNVQTSERVNLR